MNKLQCRNRILKMSRRLFTAKGYENTTIEDVAEAAEISKATLYNYFSSKEDLLQGIADAALEEIRQMVLDGLREEPDGLAKIRCVMETLVADSARYITLTRRIFFLNVSPDSELHEARAELLEILGEALDALLPEERELAVRVVGEEMPVAEFARMKKENRRTLASRRDRVLEKLRLFFEDRGFDVHK